MPSRYDPLPGSYPPPPTNTEKCPVTKPVSGQLSNRSSPQKHSSPIKIPKNEPSSSSWTEPQSKKEPALFYPNMGSQGAFDKGAQDFAKLIHTVHLSDREKLLVEALNDYKRRGFKRALFKILLMITFFICLILFTIFSIGCWSQHLELTEHLEVYDERYSRKISRNKNQTSVNMDCPLIGFLEKFWTPDSSHVDLFGKILSIISIRKLIQLLVRLCRSIKLRTTTEDEAIKNVDETQKDLKGIAETVMETLCEI